MIYLKKKSPKLLVIGDLIIDQYLWGSCERISPEAPVQVINVEKENTVLGGAGNVVNNLKALGAGVDVISVIGNDYNSEVLKELLDDIEVDTKYLVTKKNRITSKKSRIIASQQQVVRYDHESAEEILRNRGELEGGRSLTDDFMKNNTEYKNIKSFAKDLVEGKAALSDVPKLKQFFRLHPPRKGFGGIKKSVQEGGGLGMRDINTLIYRMR